MAKQEGIEIMDSTGCMALVQIDSEGKIFKGNPNIVEKKWNEIAFDEIRLSGNSKNMYLEHSFYNYDYVESALKVIKEFYQESNIIIEDLKFQETDIKDYPCIVSYKEIGFIISPKLKER